MTNQIPLAPSDWNDFALTAREQMEVYQWESLGAYLYAEEETYKYKYLKFKTYLEYIRSKRRLL